MNTQVLKLCLVTHFHDSLSVCETFLRQAIRGGVTSVQLRLKHLSPAECFDFAFAVKKMLDPLEIPLIINDHVELVKAIDADGVHLGQSDMSPVTAREILGPDKMIGWSIETLQELDQANKLSCINYVAASAVFPSQTKTDCKTIWGMEGLKKIMQLSKYPVVAIGGIDSQNASDVFKTGVAGIAVVSAIHDAVDPEMAAQTLLSGI